MITCPRLLQIGLVLEEMKLGNSKLYAVFTIAYHYICNNMRNFHTIMSKLEVTVRIEPVNFFVL